VTPPDDGGSRPGHGWGDGNHDHTGPPGQGHDDHDGHGGHGDHGGRGDDGDHGDHGDRGGRCHGSG
jgi:hypothetical protein